MEFIEFESQMDKPQNVTELLLAWGAGDKEALNDLIPLVHEELHRIAARHMRHEKRGHTLQTTALLNEAFGKLIENKDIPWKSRAHFFAIAAQIMRRILIDHARTRLRAKRGAGGQKISLDDVALVTEPRAEELIELDRALTELAEIDATKSRIVELKFRPFDGAGFFLSEHNMEWESHDDQKNQKMTVFHVSYSLFRNDQSFVHFDFLKDLG